MVDLISRSPSSLQAPIPLFGVTWSDEELYVYGGGGSKFGIQSGVYVFQPDENALASEANGQSPLRIQTFDVLYKRKVFCSSDETIWNLVRLYTHPPVGGENSFMAATPKGFRSIVSNCCEDVDFPGKKVKRQLDQIKSCMAIGPLSSQESPVPEDTQPAKTLLVLTWSIQGNPFYGVFHCASVKNRKSPSISLQKLDSTPAFDLIKHTIAQLESTGKSKQPTGEINDIALIQINSERQMLLCAAVYELQFQSGQKSACVSIFEINATGRIVPLHSLAYTLAKSTRSTKCFWLTDGPCPILGTIQISPAGSFLRSFALMNTYRLEETHCHLLTTEKTTACCVFQYDGNQHLAFGTASGQVLIFSLEPIRLIRRVTSYDSPITGLAVRSTGFPVIAITHLCGMLCLHTIMEAPHVLQPRTWVVAAALYICFIALCTTYSLWDTVCALSATSDALKG
ncbi:hypothetical protein XU18_0209 [Perkinsela sp. CCAP 1560/4]|nr:hypothetical protein XU18_0209 [Perkinsela sp. CCAP 1560/4]|eukprot:KNH09524.1 hypothetical protein XU18_0209 [Perkinsela sp. CCAP 1560/4]